MFTVQEGRAAGLVFQDVPGLIFHQTEQAKIIVGSHVEEISVTPVGLISTGEIFLRPVSFVDEIVVRIMCGTSTLPTTNI